MRLLHLILFGAYPILLLYSANASEITPEELIVPTLISVGIIGAIFTILYLFTKNVYKASVLAAVNFILIIAFGHLLKVLGIESGVVTYIAVFIYTLLLILFNYIAGKSKSEFKHFGWPLNVVAASLILMLIPQITKSANADRPPPPGNFRQSALDSVQSTQPKEPLRDIYYLVFDQYARADTLSDHFHFNNDPFINKLREYGFYVATESLSNYPHTQHSIASSLNMLYINYLEHIKTDKYPVFISMIKDSDIARFLKQQGYNTIFFGNSEWPFKLIPAADQNHNLATTHHAGYLLDLVYERSLLNYLILPTGLDPYFKELLLSGYRKSEWRNTNYKFEKIAELSTAPGPKFVYAHFLIPHAPYVHNADGTYLSLTEQKRNPSTNYYVEQIKFLNSAISELIEDLTTNSATQPIIILQADEGAFTGYKPNNFAQNSNKKVVDKYSILNAYYFPNADISTLYPSISPVNTFRVVLNQYFGTDLPLLPDKQHYTTYSRPLEFKDITSKINQ